MEFLQHKVGICPKLEILPISSNETISVKYYLYFGFNSSTCNNTCIWLSLVILVVDQKNPLQEVTASVPQPTLKSDNSTSDLASITGDLHNVTQFEKSADALPMPDNVTQIAELTSPTHLVTTTVANTNGSWPDYVKFCPTNIACDRLGPECIDCDFNETCFYGRNTSVTCQPKDMIVCLVGSLWFFFDKGHLITLNSCILSK